MTGRHGSAPDARGRGRKKHDEGWRPMHGTGHGRGRGPVSGTGLPPGRGRGGTGAAALAAALALAALPATPAHAQEESGPAGPPPYRTAESAEPVEGTPSSADAPQLEAGAIYTDQLEPGDDLYYGVVLDAESSYYLSAVAAPEPGTKVAYRDGFSLELTTTGGDACNVGNNRTFQSDGAARPIAISQVRTIAEGDACQEAGNYLLRLVRTSDATSSPAAWPVELRVMAEPAAEGERAAPPPGDWLTPEDAPAPSGQAEAVTGGTGFNDAQPIEPGNWRDDIAPGETRFYKVPVDWHQQLGVTLDLSNAELSDSFGFVSNGIGLEVYTPFRSPAVEGTTSSYNGGPTQLATITAPVAYDNRLSDEGPMVTRNRVAGWQYIAVHLHEAVELSDADTVGLTLRVAVHGDAVEGPEYAEPGLAEAGFGVTEEVRDQAREGIRDEQLAAAASNETKELLGYAGLGAGVALLGVVGAWYLIGRRAGAR